MVNQDMAKAEPIRRRESLEQLKNYFLEKGQMRNYALIVVGTNTALKISDILKLRWEQVYDFKDQQYRKEIRILRDNGKADIFYINTGMKKALEAIREETEISPGYYIFKSRKGANSPISRTCAYNIIREAARELGLGENISCQSLRKTFGYQAWKKGVKVENLQAVYGQSSREQTVSYLELEGEQKVPVIQVEI